MVYLGLKRDRDWSGNDFMTTVFECSDTERIYSAIQAGEIPDPAVLHIVMPAALKSHVEAVGAPSAKIIMPAPYAPFARAREEGESVYAELKERLAQRLIERAGAYIPSLQGAIEFHEAATPLTFEKWTGNRFGAIYGLEPVPDQFGPWRWPNAGPLKGLYFAGHYSRPAHGIVGACYSGRFAANAVLRDR
jgi:prolycopene isomerase